MTKIKIISNPYKKKTLFQYWDDSKSEWIDIGSEAKQSSDLLKEKYVTGFFPFKVKEIVDIISRDYETPDENIEVYFQGTSDEFKELSDVCAEDVYCNKIIAKKVEVDLANAHDILPKVKGLFKEMSPLIVQSVSQEKIQRDLSRFSDASSDVVPICVMGNYSAGKSTFINALIGHEILPSGNESVTAKIYKITRSKNAYKASVKCKYLDYRIEIEINDKETNFNSDLIENELSIKLMKELDELKAENLVKRVNKALQIINEFESDDVKEAKIDDLIEVDIPFANGVLGRTSHPFVIFDTPGSNSASNARHLEVLKGAMANMTNGLPIVVTTAENMDTNDNQDLYHLMLEMEELDKRFTMLVVNKADGAGIQRRAATEEEQNRILRQALPRNLYSGGLFYVSSILGLGSKNGGKFFDYIYDDIYDAQVDRYRNKENDHYKTLYLFNIQPSQLKKRSDLFAAEQDELIYVNSGLFSIEHEIDTFAGKYSAYNKCFQSQMFLTRVIDTTGEEIEDKKQECEEIRKSINDKLEVDKKALLDRLSESSNLQRDESVQLYPDYMGKFLEGAKDTFSVEEIKEQEDIFTATHEKELSYSEHQNEAKRARESMTTNLKSNIKKAFAEHSSSAVKSLVSSLQSDFGNAIETYQAQRGTRHQVDSQAADSLLEYVSNEYEKKLKETYMLLDKASQDYWRNKTEQLRNTLIQIVTGSDVLTEERRNELENIIVTFKKIIFKDNVAETIFEKQNFEKKIRIGDFEWNLSDHLNIEKLTKTYNSNIEIGAMNRYNSIEESHKKSVFQWIEELLDVIRENIVEYSPELSRQAKQIRIMSDQIEELEDRKRKLNQYTEDLHNMMDWQLPE